MKKYNINTSSPFMKVIIDQTELDAFFAAKHKPGAFHDFMSVNGRIAPIAVDHIVGFFERGDAPPIAVQRGDVEAE